jgi:predicted ABC-type ATPase
MTPDTPKRLRMFAGPNGSGKTSLIRKFAREFSADGLFQLHHYLNADDLYRNLQASQGVSLEFLGRSFTVEQIRTALLSGGRIRPDHPFFNAVQISCERLLAPANVCDDYVAAALTDFLRDELLAIGLSFSFETVMSHRSKIDFFARARAAGYRTYLYFIATESSHLNVYRVKTRAALGGHDVPEVRIVERYKRCLELVGEALHYAYRAFLFDNSGAEPIWLAQFAPDGMIQLKVAAEALPAWFRNWVAPRYPAIIP